MSRLECRVKASTPPHELPFMLRVDEVAVWLGLSEESVREAIKRGDLPARKMGSILRVKRADLVGECRRSV